MLKNQGFEIFTLDGFDDISVINKVHCYIVCVVGLIY